VWPGLDWNFIFLELTATDFSLIFHEQNGRLMIASTLL